MVSKRCKMHETSLMSNPHRKHARNFLAWSGWDCGKSQLQASLGFHDKKIVMTVDSSGSQNLSPVAENTVIVLNTDVERHHEINMTRTQWHKEELSTANMLPCSMTRHTTQQEGKRNSHTYLSQNSRKEVRKRSQD